MWLSLSQQRGKPKGQVVIHRSTLILQFSTVHHCSLGPTQAAKIRPHKADAPAPGHDYNFHLLSKWHCCEFFGGISVASTKNKAGRTCFWVQRGRLSPPIQCFEAPGSPRTVSALRSTSVSNPTGNNIPYRFFVTFAKGKLFSGYRTAIVEGEKNRPKPIGTHLESDASWTNMGHAGARPRRPLPRFIDGRIQRAVPKHRTDVDVSLAEVRTYVPSSTVPTRGGCCECGPPLFARSGPPRWAREGWYSIGLFLNV